LITSLGQSSLARADEAADCRNPVRDWVLLTVQPTQGHPIETRLLQHLRAELAAHQILVCSELPRDARAPMATVKVEGSGSQQVGIEVRVDDAVTQKVVLRQLDLTGLPPDAHAMTVALGASELLRASWAEINLRSNTETKPVPISVRHVLEAETPHNRAPASLGLRFAGEAFSGRLRQAGVDANLGLDVIGPWLVGLRFGARQGLNVNAPDGRVRAHAWMAGLTTGLRLTARDASAHLVALARVDVARVQFLAEPNPGAVARSGAGTGVFAGLGIMGMLELSPMIELVLETDAGGVLEGVRARETTGAEIVAMKGAWMGVSTGISVSLW
jgi:hypothetical protein